VSEKRKVRGLLDMLDAEQQEQPWEWEADPRGVVPGMGLGATAQATRWALLGMQVEAKAAIENALKRGVGRPGKGDRGGIDERRAFALWMLVKMQRQGLLPKPPGRSSNRALIEQYREIEKQDGEENPRLFGTGDLKSLEQSVARGRSALGIKGNEWKSEVCEKLIRI